MSETVIQSLASLEFASGWMFHLLYLISWVFAKKMFEPTAYWSEIACHGSSFVRSKSGFTCRAPCGGIWYSLSWEEAFVTPIWVIWVIFQEVYEGMEHGWVPGARNLVMKSSSFLKMFHQLVSAVLSRLRLVGIPSSPSHSDQTC